MLGTTLDAGAGPRRWERWRPTVALCMHDDLVVDRLELLYPPRWTELARQVAADVRQVAPETEVRLHQLAIANPWDLEQVYGALHDFARGYAWAPEREDYLAHITTGTHIAQICLFLLVESRRLPGRLLQTSPATSREPDEDDPRGPTDRAGRWAIIDLDLARYDQLAARFAREHRDAATLLKSGIATRSPAFNQLIDELEQVAIGSREPILLLGPTGSGKSQQARRIFELKRARRQIAGPLIEVNCATVRGDGAMSALFGHVKGAFTGAASARAGFLRQADGGVLFLDEIGELGLDEQAMLLRAIEDKSFFPVGSDKEVHSDFQLIAGTNRELAARVENGSFREDLLARINLWTFKLPGLRERPEDLSPNLDFELDRVGDALGVRLTMSREARDGYLAFARSKAALWSGNFRDLGASIRRMGTLCDGGRIGGKDVDIEIERLRTLWAPPSASQLAPIDDGGLLERVLGPQRAGALDRFDRVQLEDVVRVCRSARSLSDAGRTLFAASLAARSTSNDADRLRKYLARFDLTLQRIQTA